MYGGPSEKYTTNVLVWEAHLFKSMEEDEECAYNHTLIDESCAQGGDKKIVVLEKTTQTCARMLS